jgi:hypothetical protein
MNTEFTNLLPVQAGGCPACKRHTKGCLCVGGGWKSKAVKKVKDALYNLKEKTDKKDKSVKSAKSAKPAASAKTVKTTKSVKGGAAATGVAELAAPAYNYDGLLQETALTNSANNPGAATPLPFKSATGGSRGLKKMSELNSFEGYSLHHNKVGGGSETVQALPVGIYYNKAITTAGHPVGLSPRGLALTAAPLTSSLSPLTDTTISSTPAPMNHTVYAGNVVSDSGILFDYGAGMPATGGGLVKKLVVAAIARKAYKKYKAHKKDKAATPKKSSAKKAA